MSYIYNIESSNIPRAVNISICTENPVVKF